MSGLKTITVYNHASGPNPKKIPIICNELGIPFEMIDISNPKEDSFTKINPNGRLPAIKDPNHDDIIVWESGAIVEYLVENYDKENKLTPTSFADKWHTKQFLHFQMSGQGPYFGQAVWFFKFQPDDVPQAKDRYADQFIRVIQVLDNMVKDKKYLIGDKITYADLCFIPWNKTIQMMLPDLWAKYDIENKYPSFSAWYQRTCDRDSVKKVYGQ